MDEKQIKWAIGLGVPLLVLLIVALMSVTVVDAGHIGVATTFGAVEEFNYDEGMQIHAPWRSIVEIDTRVSLVTVECMAASSDLQSIKTTISANFYPEPTQAWKVIRFLSPEAVNWKSIILEPSIQESVKAVAAEYTAENLIKKRPEIRDRIEGLIREKVKNATLQRLMHTTDFKEASDMKTTIGGELSLLHISQVNLTNFEFSAQYTEAIESKQRAEQEAKKADNERIKKEIEAQVQIAEAVARAEADIARADGEAKAKIRGAEAEAESIRLNSEAQAKAIAAKYAALKAAGVDPAFWEWVQKWSGNLPKIAGGTMPTMMIPEDLKD
jgi:prohibitin 2